MKNSREWPEEDKNTLRVLWPDHSASKIGKLLGRSRNAVIGMAQRLFIPKRRIAANQFSKLPKATQTRQNVSTITVERQRNGYVLPPSTDQVSLLDAKRDQCRAVVDGEKDQYGLAMVCGRKVEEKQTFSFCTEHLSVFTAIKGETRWAKRAVSCETTAQSVTGSSTHPTPS